MRREILDQQQTESGLSHCPSSLSLSLALSVGNFSSQYLNFTTRLNWGTTESVCECVCVSYDGMAV